jgi:hypothetical protein
MWGLCPEVAKQWQLLESHLIAATEHIFTEANVRHTPGFTWFRTPSAYFYLKRFNTCQRMVECAMSARDAFLPLMAICSYAISLTHNFTVESAPWGIMLQAKGLRPEWVKMLETSQLADFSESNKRVGVFVQPTCGYLRYIDHMMRAHVPI